jgi:hypothetical protein
MVNPKTVTVYGRLSFPTWTAKEAFVLSQKGSYPASDVATAAPSFQLLLNETQFERLMNHIENSFLPYTQEQFKKGQKKDALDANEVKKLLAGLKGDLKDQTFNTPVKAVSDKSAALAPEAVATLKVIGPKGGEIEQRAIVNDENELKVPDPDLLTYPVIKPIEQTTHEMYPGAQVAVTLNLYAYHNGKHPGFSAGASTAVFRMDAERFGGSVAVDEDAIFLD